LTAFWNGVFGNFDNLAAGRLCLFYRQLLILVPEHAFFHLRLAGEFLDQGLIVG